MRDGAVEPHGVVEARGHQALVGPGQAEHPQGGLEDRVVADVGQGGGVALGVGEPLDRPQRVVRLDPDGLVGCPPALDGEVDRAGHVAHVEAAPAGPVGLRGLGHGAAGAALEVVGGRRQVLGIAARRGVRPPGSCRRARRRRSRPGRRRPACRSGTRAPGGCCSRGRRAAPRPRSGPRRRCRRGA